MTAGERWWERPWVVLAATLAAAVPLLWPSIPPLIDLPSHMASYHVALWRNAPTLSRYFAFEWELIGNLGVDLLVMPFGRMFGTEFGSKIAVLLIPLLTAAGFLAVARAAHDRLPATALAAVPLAYAYPLMFGFVNYCLSVAVAMLGLALWLRWPSDRRALLRALAFAGIAILAWLSHAIGWIMLGTMCGAAELYRRLRIGQRWLPAVVGTALAGAPLLAPALLMPFSPRGEGLTTYGWFDVFALAKWVLMSLRDRWIYLDIASLLALAALLGAALLRAWGLRFEPKLMWPALALTALFVVAPGSINGSDFVNGRIAPYALALGVLAIDTRAVRQPCAAWLALASLAFLAIRLGANTASLALYSRTYDRHLEALRHVPKGGTVAVLSKVPCGGGFDNWFNARLYHLSGMAVVRNDAFVNATWAIPGLHMLRSRYAAAGQFQADPSEAVFLEACPSRYTRTLPEALDALPLDAFDRLWLLDIPRERWPRSPRLRMLWSTDDAAIYEIVHAPAARAP
jgi:hypothetical protein